MYYVFHQDIKLKGLTGYPGYVAFFSKKEDAEAYKAESWKRRSITRAECVKIIGDRGTFKRTAEKYLDKDILELQS